jgi:hypothetical protein
MPKREHPDEVPLMLYIWRSWHVDPRRQTWMRDGIWSEADLSTFFFSTLNEITTYRRHGGAHLLGSRGGRGCRRRRARDARGGETRGGVP